MPHVVHLEVVPVLKRPSALVAVPLPDFRPASPFSEVFFLSGIRSPLYRRSKVVICIEFDAFVRVYTGRRFN